MLVKYFVAFGHFAKGLKQFDHGGAPTTSGNLGGWRHIDHD